MRARQGVSLVEITARHDRRGGRHLERSDAIDLFAKADRSRRSREREPQGPRLRRPSRDHEAPFVWLRADRDMRCRMPFAWDRAVSSRARARRGRCSTQSARAPIRVHPQVAPELRQWRTSRGDSVGFPDRNRRFRVSEDRRFTLAGSFDCRIDGRPPTRMFDQSWPKMRAQQRFIHDRAARRTYSQYRGLPRCGERRAHNALVRNHRFQAPGSARRSSFDEGFRFSESPTARSPRSTAKMASEKRG